MNSREIIIEMEKLPLEERQVVIRYFERDTQEEYSEEAIAELLERKKDAQQGINMSECIRGEDISSPLKNLLRPR